MKHPSPARALRWLLENVNHDDAEQKANAYITATVHVASPGRRKAVGHKVEGNYDKRDSKY